MVKSQLNRNSHKQEKTMTSYQRVILKGTLTTQSNFHIGTGQEDKISVENTKDEISYNALCLDSNGQPYIPASTLRGLLRNIIETHEDSKNEKITSTTLFGLAKQEKDKKADGKADQEETGNMGAMRVYDCRWDENKNQGKYQQKIISQTSIDPITQTAQEHQLLSHAIVKPQSVFTLRIELDKVTSQEIGVVLKALNTFDTDYGSQLGKSKNSGFGALNWTHQTINVLTQEKFQEWLNPNTNKNNKVLKEYFQDSLGVPEINSLIEVQNHSYTNLQQKTLTLQLEAKSPLLIVDSPYSKTEADRRKELNKTNKDTPSYTELFEADLYFTQQGDYAVIPGSTLKGWVRARCRKILLTLFHKELHKNVKKGGGGSSNTQVEAINAQADKHINQLFGSTESQSLVQFFDAKIKLSECEMHQQTFNAIDRFTGGTLDTALYHVEAIWPQKSLNTEIRYQHKQLKDWMKLLLLLSLRDAMQGDLVLGWGKSKGYGQLIAKHKDYSDWQGYFESLALSSGKLNQWQTDLDEIITIATNEQSSNENKEQVNTEEASL